MSKILIVGHSGLIGNRLLQVLTNQGHIVFGVSRTDRHKVSHNIVCADLTNPEVTEQIFQEIKPEIVYLLAANACESRGQISPIDMTMRNVGLAVNVLRSAMNVKVKKFIYASSISVYGDAPTPYSESSTPKPKDVYGVNKLAFEQILKIMADVYKFDYTILRPHNVYGPGQNMNDPYKNVVALFMRKLLLREPYVMYGEGKMKRAFSYVDDVADVFAQAKDKFSKLTINVGSTQETTIKELSDLLQRITALSVDVEQKASRPQEMHDFIADHTIQEDQLVYLDTPLLKGLIKTWEWVQVQPLTDLEVKENEIKGDL